MQYGHCVVSATATAIKSCTRRRWHRLLQASLSNAQKAFIGSRTLLIQFVQLGEALHIKHVDNSPSGMCVEDEMYGDFLWLQASRLQEGARIRTESSTFQSRKTIAKLIPMTCP